MAIFAAAVAPYDPAAQSVVGRLKPPVWQARGDWAHLLGTDQLGRDILSRLISARAPRSSSASRSSPSPAPSASPSGSSPATAADAPTPFSMRLVDIQVAFPGLLLILLIVAVIGPSMGTMIVVLALTNWMIYARVVRGIVLSVRQTPLRRGGGDDRLLAVRRHLPTHPAEPLVAAPHPRHPRVHQHRAGRGGAFLPRPGRAAAGDELGPRYLHRQGLHLRRLVAGHLPRPLHLDHRPFASTSSPTGSASPPTRRSARSASPAPRRRSARREERKAGVRREAA